MVGVVYRKAVRFKRMLPGSVMRRKAGIGSALIVSVLMTETAAAESYCSPKWNLSSLSSGLQQLSLAFVTRAEQEAALYRGEFNTRNRQQLNSLICSFASSVVIAVY